MTTTKLEDQQYLNEVIEELKQAKKRGRPKGSKNSKNKDIIQEDIIEEDITKNEEDHVYIQKKKNE